MNDTDHHPPRDGETADRIAAEAWVREHHTASGRIRRATDGHPMCDEDEMPFPCPVVLTLQAVTERAEAAEQALAGKGERLARLERLYSALADIYLRGGDSEAAQSRVADAFLDASVSTLTWNSPDGPVTTTLGAATPAGPAATGGDA